MPQQQYGGESRATNVLFRVGRVCGKLYGGYQIYFDATGRPKLKVGTKGSGNVKSGGNNKKRNKAAKYIQTADEYDKVFIALADCAVSRTLDAVGEPTSVRI
jgi:hypothetical protein